MKLISKTILYYLLISLPLLIIAGFLSYFLIRSELRDGTDETLNHEKSNAEKTISSLVEPKIIYLSSDSLSYIKPSIINFTNTILSDTSVFDKTEEEHIPYRKLSSYYNYKGNTFNITICKTTLEEEELLEGLLSAFALIVLFLLAAFFIVNWLLSKTLWKPFYKTLSGLNNYDIKKHEPYVFESASTSEFNQLNNALNKMTDKIYSDFKQQKEFTENASHEMQTPLAIVKANISLLMQSPNLKEEEMNQLQTIENTLKKLSSLNKTLLLLTKIENNQFNENVKINLIDVAQKTINNYSDLIEAKKIELETNFSNDFEINMNPALSDILISNLLQNAIRHNHKGGKILITINGSVLSVKNTGEPLKIKEDDLFVRFKKNDASKDSLGLGLSIVKSIADTYNFSTSYNYSNFLHSFSIKFI